MEERTYLAWKCEQVVAALKARGLTPAVEPVRPVPLGSRRRAALTLGRSQDGAALGYHRARSHDLIDVSTCPVLTFHISQSLVRLKRALAPLLGGKREARVTVIETLDGLDPWWTGFARAPLPSARLPGRQARSAWRG
jgi:23S rRNA (uracil1939-C5)-methyltransferase